MNHSIFFYMSHMCHAGYSVSITWAVLYFCSVRSMHGKGSNVDVPVVSCLVSPVSPLPIILAIMLHLFASSIFSGLNLLISFSCIVYMLFICCWHIVLGVGIPVCCSHLNSFAFFKLLLLICFLTEVEWDSTNLHTWACVDGDAVLVEVGRATSLNSDILWFISITIYNCQLKFNLGILCSLCNHFVAYDFFLMVM